MALSLPSTQIQQRDLRPLVGGEVRKVCNCSSSSYTVAHNSETTHTRARERGSNESGRRECLGFESPGMERANWLTHAPDREGVRQ